MKILKQPDISKWEYRFTCAGCNCELLATKDDIKYSSYEGYYNEPSSEAFYLECPVCQGHSSLEALTLPALLKIEVKKRLKPFPVDRGGLFDR
jgi:hypothetical protein